MLIRILKSFQTCWSTIVKAIYQRKPGNWPPDGAPLSSSPRLSVFFEALFSDRPTVCRKLHNIAGSIIELVRSLLVRFFGITKYASEFFELTNNIGVSEELTVKANSNINTFSYHEGSRKVQIKLSSIHAVKGRTHLATLVLDTYWYKRNLKSIMPWLRNIASKSPSERDAKRLKCHYVAITRAKGLICLAAPKSSISDKDKTNLIKAGWNITEL